MWSTVFLRTRNDDVRGGPLLLFCRSFITSRHENLRLSLWLFGLANYTTQ
jgi:hypothetical protein